MDLDQAHPDPHLECGPGSKRENDCGSGSIAQVLASALPLVYQQVLSLFHKSLGLL